MKPAFEEIMRMRNPDRMFDLVCAGNYFMGQFNGNIPVDESRKVFEKIKKLLDAKRGKR